MIAATPQMRFTCHFGLIFRSTETVNYCCVALASSPPFPSQTLWKPYQRTKRRYIFEESAEHM
ncbi:hypothetical protein ACVWXO_001809 [Bradyrhizobium sp. LM2.7]